MRSSTDGRVSAASAFSVGARNGMTDGSGSGSNAATGCRQRNSTGRSGGAIAARLRGRA